MDVAKDPIITLYGSASGAGPQAFHWLIHSKYSNHATKL
jgi:hypothetical protein